MIRHARLVPGIHGFYLFDEDVWDEGAGGREISTATPFFGRLCP
jgi:hypothetical protein